MQRITKFSAIIGFLAVMAFVIGMFMYMPTFTNHGAALSPIAAFGWDGDGGGGCCDGGGGGGGGGDNEFPSSQRPVCTLNASPSTITQGGRSTLTWRTDRATSVSINAGIGRVSLDGSKVVAPSRTTKYVLTATGPGGTVTCSDTVTVKPPVAQNPVCTLTATPTTVKKGENVTFRWTTENATRVLFSGAEVAKNGSRTFAPDLSRTFTLVASNAAGKSVTCSKHITVVNEPVKRPVCTLTANPSTINRGENSRLTWTTQNAETVTLDGGAVAKNNSRIVAPLATRTFVLVATNAAGNSVTCREQVTVVRDVPDRLTCDAFYANPSHINDEDGGRTVLSWNTTGATRVSINQGVGSVPVDGSRSVFVDSDRTFTLTASNAQDTVTCHTSVTVDEDDNDTSRPVCEAFRASDRDIDEGDKVELSWETRRGDELTIKDNDGHTVFDTDDEDEVEDGDITVSPDEDTTYTLKVYDDNNKTDTCTVRVEVDEDNNRDDDEDIIITSTIDREPITSISFNRVPYTGFDAGPLLAVTFYSLLALWAFLASYIVVIKKGSVLGFSLATIGMGATNASAGYVAPVVVAHSATAYAPTNLPVATDEEEDEEEEEIMEDDSDEEEISIENRAFAANMILSKDAVATIKRAGASTEERLAVLDAIIARAKESYPREDGWIALDKGRIAALFN